MAAAFTANACSSNDEPRAFEAPAAPRR
jgi:hypothetical protein